MSLFIGNFSIYSGVATNNIEVPNRYETLEGEYITIDNSEQGELHEIEVFGNTVQDKNNLEDIQSVGDLYVDEDGNPILDSQGRKQYKIDIVSKNNNLFNINGNIYESFPGNHIMGDMPKVENGNLLVNNYTEFDGYGQTIKVKPNTEYTLSCQTEDAYKFKVEVYTKNKVLIDSLLSHMGKVTFNTGSNSEIFLMFKSMGVDRWMEIKELKLEEGTEKTSYTPYNTSTTTILLPTQLQKVEDVADRLHWDNEKNKYVVEKNIGVDLLPKAPSGTTETDTYYQNTQYASFADKKLQTGHPLNYKNFLSLDNYPYYHYYNIYGDDNGSGVNIWGNHVTWRIYKTDIGSIEDFNALINEDWRIMGVLKNPEIIETTMTSKIKIPTYDGKTNIYVETENGINPALKVKIDRLHQMVQNAIQEARINPTTENISLARVYINMLDESEYKEELHEQLNQVFASDVTFDKKTLTANLDVYIKSENMLLMNLSTNSVTFDDYSGVDEIVQENAVEISINSSLPYQLNAYLLDEIYNNDRTKKIDTDRLNIKDNTDTDYKEFADINEKLVLKDSCEPGNNKSHSIDLKLKGGNAYESDIYKTIIKFEAQQK